MTHQAGSNPSDANSNAQEAIIGSQPAHEPATNPLEDVNVTFDRFKDVITEIEIIGAKLDEDTDEQTFLTQLSEKLEEYRSADADSKNTVLNEIQDLIESSPEQEVRSVLEKVKKLQSDEVKTPSLITFLGRSLPSEQQDTPEGDSTEAGDAQSGPTAKKELSYNRAGRLQTPESLCGQEVSNESLEYAIIRGNDPNNKALLKDLTVVEGCPARGSRYENVRMENVDKTGQDSSGSHKNVTIVEGCKFHNNNMAGTSWEGISFEMGGKTYSSEELLEYGNSSEGAKEEVAEFLKKLFQGSTWDSTTRMEPAFATMLLMISTPIESLTPPESTIQSVEILQKLLNDGNLIADDSHTILRERHSMRFDAQADNDTSFKTYICSREGDKVRVDLEYNDRKRNPLKDCGLEHLEAWSLLPRPIRKKESTKDLAPWQALEVLVAVLDYLQRQNDGAPTPVAPRASGPQRIG